MNALLYALGFKSEDIFTSFTFDDSADQKNNDPVKEKFDHHFVAKKNVIYERAKIQPTRTRSERTSGLNSLQIFIAWPNSVNMDL